MLLKTTRVAALGLAAAGILATSAAAQTAPTAPAPAPAPTQSAPPATYFSPQPFQDLNRIEERIWRQSLTDTAQTAPTKAQWARARRAAELVNANRCDEAFALARTEKDNRLETGVSKVCLARRS